MTLPLVYHPQHDENGHPVLVRTPSVSTAEITWYDPAAVATLSVTDHGRLPPTVCGTPFTDVPCPESSLDWLPYNSEWSVAEPPYPKDPVRCTTSGCVVIEPDDRVWLVHPTNEYADQKTTFPKGRWEAGLTLLTNAVKETLEESGLWVKPTGYLCDVVRTRSITRYYTARRIGGTPKNAGWESQAVSLVPPSALAKFLNRENDRKVLPFLLKKLLEEGTLPL